MKMLFALLFGGFTFLTFTNTTLDYSEKVSLKESPHKSSVDHATNITDEGILSVLCPDDIFIEVNCAESCPYTPCVLADWPLPTVSTSPAYTGTILIENLTYDDATTQEALFPLGTTTVQYRIQDDNCNTLTCSFNVTVETTSSLSFINNSCPPDITLEAEDINGVLGAIHSWDPFEFENDCDCYDSCTDDDPATECCYPNCPVYVNLVQGLPSGSVFPVGTTLVKFQAFNGNGSQQCNDEVYCNFNVTVVDTQLRDDQEGQSTSRGGTEQSSDATDTSWDCTAPPNVDGGVPVISILPDEELGIANSYIIATHRNHVWHDFTLALACHTPSLDWEQYREKVLTTYGNQVNPQFGQGRKLYRFGGTSVEGLISGEYGITGWHFNCHSDPSPSAADIMAPYPYDNFNNYIYEANELNADMLVTVNYGSGTAEEAADVVEYLTPHGVVFYEIGNEVNAGDVNGWENCNTSNTTTITEAENCIGEVTLNHDACTAYNYGVGAAEYVEKMRTAAGNHSIKIGIVASYAGEWGGNWPNSHLGTMEQTFRDLLEPMDDRTTMTGIDCLPDYIIFHNYPSPPLAPGAESDGSVAGISDTEYAQLVMAHNTREINLIENIVRPALQTVQAELVNQKAPITFGNTEYYTHVLATHRPEISNSVLDALYTADNMITALDLDLEMAVNAALYTKANEFACLDPNNPNVFQNNSINLFFDACNLDHHFPAFDIHKEVSDRFGSTKVKSQGSNLPETTVNHYTGGDQTTFEDLGYYATKKADGTIILFVVNRTEFDVGGVVINPNMDISSVSMFSLVGTTYSGDEFTTIPADPDNEVFIPDLSAVDFPAASVSFIEIVPCPDLCETIIKPGIEGDPYATCTNVDAIIALWPPPTGYSSICWTITNDNPDHLESFVPSIPFDIINGAIVVESNGHILDFVAEIESNWTIQITVKGDNGEIISTCQTPLSTLDCLDMIIGSEGDDRALGTERNSHNSAALSTYQGDIKLYPNPTRDKVMIAFTDFVALATDQVSIDIINTKGQIVETIYKSYQKNYTIDLSHLSTGLYLVKVNTLRDSNYYVQKLVVE